jgi:hypothetical protein
MNQLTEKSIQKSMGSQWLMECIRSVLRRSTIFEELESKLTCGLVYDLMEKKLRDAYI